MKEWYENTELSVLQTAGSTIVVYADKLGVTLTVIDNLAWVVSGHAQAKTFDSEYDAELFLGLLGKEA